MSLQQKAFAELIGTFALIFVGVSSICVNAGLVGVALAHGLTIAVMVSALGFISGGHFNPAVTFGVLLGKKISLKDTIVYIFAQLVGGVLGAIAANQFLPADMVQASSLGTPMLASGTSMVAGIGMEFILTFFLVLVVYGTAVDSRAAKMGGLFIGLTVALDILAGGPITGASMNPARTFGPAIVSGYWDNHLVYWIGPLLGGGAAGLFYSKYLGKEGM